MLGTINLLSCQTIFQRWILAFFGQCGRVYFFQQTDVDYSERQSSDLKKLINCCVHSTIEFLNGMVNNLTQKHKTRFSRSILEY